MGRGTIRIKQYLEDVITIKWLAVGVVFYFYGFMLKKEVITASLEMGIPFNHWDITLRLLNDMYLIVYFIIPVILFFSIKSILRGFDYQILIRLGSFKKWVYYSVKQFWLRSSPLLILWGFVSLFIIIGLSFSWEWSPLSQTDQITNTLYEVAIVLERPIIVMVAQLFLLVMTFSVLHLILAIVYVLTKSKYFMLLLSVVIFLGSVIGFKLLPSEIAFLSPTTYFSITKAVDSFQAPVFGYFAVLLVGLISIFYLNVIDLNNKVVVDEIKPYIPLAIYFLLVLIGVISVSTTLNPQNSTIWDVFAMSFRGSNSENFAYIPFFFYFIVFFGFVYLVQLFLSKEIEQLGYYKIIRYRNLNKWFWSWMKKLLFIVGAFLFLLLMLALIVAVCFGMNTSFYVTVLSNSLYEVIYHFYVNGFLQITFYIYAVFIVSWASKEPIHSVLLISLFMVLMLPGINTLGAIPVGLNSSVYLVNFSPYYLTFILTIMNLLAMGVINNLFRRSLKI
jgi:hypothetical protein